MPEKTLKEKVERARENLKRAYDMYTQAIIEEALTALEERIAELEKENAQLVDPNTIFEFESKSKRLIKARIISDTEETSDGK